MKAVVSTVVSSSQPEEKTPAKKAPSKKKPTAFFIVLAVLVFLSALAGGYYWGNSVGSAAGYEEGHDDGYSLGYSAGYSSGHSEGRKTGYNSGYNYGYTEGFNSGYASHYSSAQQESKAPTISIIVYVTDTGDKYHRSWCSYLQSSHAISLSNAKSLGYTPCSRCNPPC